MTTVVWLLAALVVAAALWQLFRTAVAVWRDTKGLGRSVGRAADEIAAVTAALGAAQERRVKGETWQD